MTQKIVDYINREGLPTAMQESRLEYMPKDIGDLVIHLYKSLRESVELEVARINAKNARTDNQQYINFSIQKNHLIAILMEVGGMEKWKSMLTYLHGRKFIFDAEAPNTRGDPMVWVNWDEFEDFWLYLIGPQTSESFSEWRSTRLRLANEWIASGRSSLETASVKG